MAVFKTLRAKAKEYTLKYGGNDKLKEPARAVFARFPLPDEKFLKPGNDINLRDIDFQKVGKKDEAEMQRLFSSLISFYMEDEVKNGGGGRPAPFSRVDAAAFLRECVDHFENFQAETGTGEALEIRTVNQFLALPADAVYAIALELYAYAMERDRFTMGESGA